MTQLIMQPSRARLYPQIPRSLSSVLASEFANSPRVFDLFEGFFHHESYARSFTSTLLSIAKKEGGAPWDVRRLAILMLHHHVLLLPPEAIEEYDFLFGELGLKTANTSLAELKATVLDEGYTTTEPRDFIQQFRRKLERHQPVHHQIKGYETTPQGLRDFIHLSRQECKLSLARYLFTPEDVVEQILKQVRVSTGKEDLWRARYRYNEEEAANTISFLPDYEATILRKLSENATVYWVAEQTKSTLNALVEYPLTTVALVVKPPGSDIEFEVKRTGRKSHPLGAVYRREGRKVTPCHRLDGGCKHTSLLFEAGAASVITKIFRSVHNREAPVAKMTSVRWVNTVPVGTEEVNLQDYFTDPESFGEGYRGMRVAMEECANAYRKRSQKRLLQNPKPLDLTRDFLYWVKPGQATLVGSSSFRLETLARYLGPEGLESYFEEGLGVPYTAEEARRFVDEILLETLGVYSPPEVPYQSHEQYITAAYAVPKNRRRANQVYQSVLREIGTFWGTIMAVRGYSGGESFVGRNVGLRSVWHEGQWQVEVIFMDHDKLFVARKEDFHPRAVIESTRADERFIFGRPGIKTEISDIGAVDFLNDIYQVDQQIAEAGKAALFEAQKKAYRKTLDAFADKADLQSLFGPSFVRRIQDWDTMIRKFLPVADDPAGVASWKAYVRRFLGGKGYAQDLVEEHIEAVDKYRRFLIRYSLLFE